MPATAETRSSAGPGDTHDPDKFAWAIPLMRAGYAGRGVTYLAVGLLTLWSIWQVGDTKGMSEVLAALETSVTGTVALVLIALGMAAYFVWREVCAVWDLEDYGTGAKGIVSRLGQATTGAIHLGIAVAAAAVLLSGGDGGSGERSAIARGASTVMSMPGGVWLVGAAGLATLGAGIYYGWKALSGAYRRHLRANAFTRNWNRVLEAGLLAQGAVVGIIGVFLTWAALTRDPDEAGGMGKAFEWLSGQVYGQILVSALALGLLAFALFLFVNARHRIVPRASDPEETTSLRDALSGS